MRSLAAILVFLCACQDAWSQGITLRYAQAYSALRSIFALPLFVAEREGYFVREGLNFSMLPIAGGGERLVAALHDGTADISHVATPFLIQSVLSGSDEHWRTALLVEQELAAERTQRERLGHS